ncbi:multiheme c-type cytochrome [uncultured Maribacter sp.]|uniref:multiheme c-type cytochrome n=1 Tax=uncultured Maribacter sp. TaxID=431308 RepID=UPI0030D8B224
MNNKIYLKYIIFLIVSILLIYGIWYMNNSIKISKYIDPEIIATHYNGSNFVGSQTCLECHTDIYNTHIETAHFNTSSTADKEHIKGSFKEDSIELNLKGVKLIMLEENDEYFQVSEPKFGDIGTTTSKIDIVVGSGVKGQSYLSWQDEDLVQLQASYFQPTSSWVNSPNFPDYSLNRKVDDNCLKCHVTFAKNKNESGIGNSYDRSKIILGIDCQRCHGPSEKHVIYHRKNPEAIKGEFVDSYKTYSRQQRLDACAVCHSGLQGQQIKGNPFSFLAGDTLSLYSKNYKNINSKIKLDVHGNQMGLLSESECFINSPKMDCLTCHNPHKNQRADMNIFNSKCLTCHDSNRVNSVTENHIHDNQQNCIACHMPLVPSEVMKLKLENDSEEIPVYIRTHLIGIYN